MYQSNVMKQIVMLLIMCLCLTSCSISENGDTNSTSIDFSEESSPLDEQANYNVYVWDMMCELDDVYYFVMNTSIYYYDQASGQSGVLCGKVECEHKTHTCNGFVGPENFIAAYDGKIYTIASSLAGTKLYRVNPDGTNREEVRELNSLDGSNSRVYIHRGYVYTSKTTQQVVNGQTSTTFQMYQYELDNNNDPVLIMEETYEFIEAVHYHFVEDEIYMILPYMNNDQNEVSIRKINVSSRETEELWVGDVGGRVTNFVIDEGKLQIASRISDKSSKIQILEFDLETNSLEKGKKLKYAKGTYNISKEYINLTADLSNIYTIMDYKGKIIDEGSFFEVEEDPSSMITCAYIGEDDGALFFQWIRTYEKNGKGCYDAYVLKWTPDSVDVLVEYNYVAE